MGRNIKNYESTYLGSNFEEIQVRYRRKKVLEVLNDYSPFNILEIGCGIDSICNYYKKYDKFVIVEPSKLFCDKISTVHSNDSKVTIIQDFIENQIDRLSNENFDFIIISSLLHEVPDPELLLKSISNLCSKNTTIHINVPNNKAFHLLWAYESGLIKSLGNLTEKAISLQQNTTFDIEELKNIILKCNYRITDSGSYFIKPFNHSKMYECIKSGIIEEKLLDGLYNMVKYMPELGSEIFVNARCKID